MSISILKRMTVKSNTDLRPWSHRQNVLVKVLITIAAGVASAFVGTFAHRMGAELNIPYGLVLAFLIIGLSTWCARSRMGVVGLALHLIASSDCLGHGPDHHLRQGADCRRIPRRDAVLRPACRIHLALRPDSRPSDPARPSRTWFSVMPKQSR